MSGNLTTRLERLETKARVVMAHVPKIVRLCITDEDVAAVWKDAEQHGIDTDDVMVIQLVPLQPREPYLLVVQ